MVGTSEIKNLEKYLSRMSKSLPDKLFWVNKVQPDIIVDFGCADGSLLKEIASIFDCHLVGYDMDETMFLNDKDKIDAYFTSDWEEVTEIVSEFERPLIVLSSVIHEVYSYSSSVGIKHFWHKILNGQWKWIAIRDMMVDSSTNYFTDIDAYNKILKYGNKNTIELFEKEWGSIDTNYKNIIHFLLKYRYVESFEREMPENYLPITFELILDLIPYNYKTVVLEHYILPWLKDKVKDDFDIDLASPTHLKLLIERN